MGRDTLKPVLIHPEYCPHGRWEKIYDDHILLGNIYVGSQCIHCRSWKPELPGALELGTYR